MRIKGFIFDYGGTLDTRGNHWGKVLWHGYERTGVPVGEQDFRDAYVYGERTLATSPIVKPDFTFRDTLQAKIRLQLQWLEEKRNLGDATGYLKRILEDVYQQTMQTTKESALVLEELAKKYPLVLVSNFYGNIATVLREFSLDHLFGDIIESAVVGIRKPDARIFALGVERLGMKAEEVAVVGDSYDKDILPSHSIGCHTIWFKGEGWTDEVVENPVADKVIGSLKEILSLAE